MKNTQLIPRKDDDRDIGYKWSMGLEVQHYWRSRNESRLAVSHCGQIVSKSKLKYGYRFSKCTYCEFVENQRETEKPTERT